jgi:hypothetical protein
MNLQFTKQIERSDKVADIQVCMSRYSGRTGSSDGNDVNDRCNSIAGRNVRMAVRSLRISKELTRCSNLLTFYLELFISIGAALTATIGFLLPIEFSIQHSMNFIKIRSADL